MIFQALVQYVATRYWGHGAALSKHSYYLSLKCDDFHGWNHPSTGFPRPSPFSTFHMFIVTLVTPNPPNGTWRLVEDSCRLRWKSSVWKRCRGSNTGIQWCSWTDFDPFFASVILEEFWMIFIHIYIYTIEKYGSTDDILEPTFRWYIFLCDDIFGTRVRVLQSAGTNGFLNSE